MILQVKKKTITRGFATSGLTEDPLAREEGPELSTELHDRELGPCEGLQRGLGEACTLLDTMVKISESSTGICISLLYSLASVFALFALLVLR